MSSLVRVQPWGAAQPLTHPSLTSAYQSHWRHFAHALTLMPILLQVAFLTCNYKYWKCIRKCNENVYGLLWSFWVGINLLFKAKLATLCDWQMKGICGQWPTWMLVWLIAASITWMSLFKRHDRTSGKWAVRTTLWMVPDLMHGIVDFEFGLKV